MALEPVAFLSYSREDDRHEHGRLSDICRRLSDEVRFQRGVPFRIFQDAREIAWGEQWQSRIDASIDDTSFLIPIVTPNFLVSPHCRAEFERFLVRETTLGRRDLILPIYYQESPLLTDPDCLASDRVVAELAARQFVDWRDRRFEPIMSPTILGLIAGMAAQIGRALDRSGVHARPPAAAPVQITDAATPPSSPPPRASGPLGPAIKTAPPVAVVDPASPGARTLAEAIAAAPAGGRILVRPGVYRESVVIDKVLEIVGDGDRGAIVVEAADTPAVAFRATMGRVANLTLRQRAGAPASAVDIGQGRLDLEDCDITSASLACVTIHDDAEPRLRRNRIHDGAAQGVLVTGQAGGAIEGNEIVANGGAGIEVRAGAGPAVRHNRIHKGRRGGILVLDGGQGVFEDNELFGNAYAAIEITTGANPVLRRNVAHDGLAGVFVNNRGRGTLEDNEIAGSTMAGVTITTGGDPVLARNRIHRGAQAGVLVTDRGAGRLLENVITHNGGAGVVVTAEGRPTLTGNRISDNASVGVWLYQGGGGAFHDNDLRDNGLGAWHIAADVARDVSRTGNRE